MDRHWTDDDFLERIYGLGPEAGHLDKCAPCRESWAQFQARRGAVLASVEREVASGLLVAQRRAVMERISAPPRPLAKRIVPVLATAGAVALGVFLALPPERPTATPQPPAISDAQLFQETAAIGQSSEPRGAKPIEALFQ